MQRSIEISPLVYRRLKDLAEAAQVEKEDMLRALVLRAWGVWRKKGFIDVSFLPGWLPEEVE